MTTYEQDIDAVQTADTLAAIDEAASEITGLWWTGPSENAHVKTEVVAAIIARHLGMAAPPAAPAASKITEGGAAFNALAVIVLTPHIREYLRERDPKALEQARKALERDGRVAVK